MPFDLLDINQAPGPVSVLETITSTSTVSLSTSTIDAGAGVIDAGRFAIPIVLNDKTFSL